MLAEDPHVLLGFDCEETSGTWLFLDLLRNRVLHTCELPYSDHEALHKALEGLQEALGITFVGSVSDEQPSIVTCHDLYYPEVHHQYCQFHFLRNTWRHAEALDSNVFMPLQKRRQRPLHPQGLPVRHRRVRGKRAAVHSGGLPRRRPRPPQDAEDSERDLQAASRNDSLRAA